MKLKTSLQLSAIFPIIFALATILWLRFGLKASAPRVAIDFFYLALTGVLGLGMAGIILYYSGYILKKITVLNKWIDGVLAGNLEQKIDVGTDDDEISRLSRALGAMLKDLKTAYTGIQQESMFHKQAAEKRQRNIEASQHTTRHLLKALEKLKEQQKQTLQRQCINA